MRGALRRAMGRVDLRLTVVTLAGQAYVLLSDGDGKQAFPHGGIEAGESPAAAARRVVKEWTGTDAPKLELMDFVPREDALELVFRAFLTGDPVTDRKVTGAPRGGLPDRVNGFDAAALEEMQKTSLSYKLTRG